MLHEKTKKYIENEVEVYAHIYMELYMKLPVGIKSADITKAANQIYHGIITQNERKVK